ncbi:MAG: 1-(5-phosphoribosyl)-5-[(5-phosphoribosylamino)methylideneamino]imidazole-4-carboxamide isomerase [Bacteroidota bacterium]
MQLIPAIDLIEGKCVRLTEGDYATRKIYNEDPLEVALAFEDAALERLHMVDLDGARTGSPVNLKVLEKIAAKTSLIIDFGGGIKKDQDLSDVFNAGATLATIGSVAVKDPELFASWVKKYGPDQILLGADVKNEKIAVGGWLETTDVWLLDFLQRNLELGLRQVFVTDISKDGKLEGPSFELYKKVIGELEDIQLIASGGVSGIGDLEKLAEDGLHGAIIGKAIYEGRVSLKELTALQERMKV